MAAQYDLPSWVDKASAEDILKLIYLQFFGGAAVPSGGGGGAPVTQPSVTEHPVALGASANQVIPVGAISWAAVLLTGTGTINGVAMPLNVPLSGGKLAATVTIATAGGSSAFVLYET